MHRWTRPTLWTLATVAVVACGSDADDAIDVPPGGDGTPDGSNVASGGSGSNPDPDAGARDGAVPAPPGFTSITDLNTRGEAVVPQNFVELGAMILFSAYDNVHGERIFRTDGTAAGTQLLATLNPNLELQPGYLSAPNLRGGVALGGQFFFTANDGVHGTELWKTDGTPQGTTLAFDLNPEPGVGSAVNSLTVMAGSLYFYAANVSNGARSLWKSDGTAAGTAAFLEQYDSSLVVLGDKLIFAAGGTGPQGREPWISDGTAAGSHVLRDVFPGAQGGQPTSFTKIGNRVFFWANDGAHGTEVWSTDGSEAGTTLAADVNPGAGNGQASGYTFTELAGEAYFQANDGSSGTELWRSNGAGAARVRDIAVGAAGSFPAAGGVVGNTLFFTASDGIHGVELWKTDGSEAGTSLVKDIVSGAGSSMPYAQVAYAGSLYFAANDGVHGFELWRSDGTEAGTTLLKDIRPGSAGAGIGAFHAYSQPTVALGKLLFAADDGERNQALYTSDGTEAGTHVLLDLAGGATSSSIDPSHAPTVMRGNQMLFYATDGNTGPAPYVTDGTSAGTLRLAELATVVPERNAPARRFIAPVVAGAQFFFAASDAAHGLELWCSDGTPAGTRLTRDIGPAAAGGVGLDQPLVASGNSVYFPSTGGLWRSDGSEAGTVPVLDQSVPSNVFQLGKDTPQVFDLGGTLLFFGANAGGVSLLRIDGVTATPLSPVLGPPQLLAGVVEGAVLGNKLYFTAGSGSLWISDGTPEGTRSITSIGAGPSASVHGFVGLGAQVAFVGDDGTNGAQLWSSDGTAEGTRVVSPIQPAVDAGMPFAIAYRDRLFFAAADGVSGVEPWSTDLSAAGTLRVADLAVGDASSNPGRFVVYRDQLFFVATDGVHGAELWRTDGSATGTQLVGDLNPGPRSSPSSPLGVIGDDLLLFGNDGVHGVEPWRFTLP